MFFVRLFSWISDEWHKCIIGLLALDHLYDRLKPWWERGENFVEHRWHERRNYEMEITDLLKYEAALPEIKAWLQASVALVEKIESIRTASAVPQPTGGSK
jgi:hypothetical protein